MTQQTLDRIRGATVGTSFALSAAADAVPLGRPMSPEAQASFTRQATVLERDLNTLGLQLPASGRLSIKAVDAALKGLEWPVKKRIEFKSTLPMFGVIE
jgi:hypothetical protein